MHSESFLINTQDITNKLILEISYVDLYTHVSLCQYFF